MAEAQVRYEQPDVGLVEVEISLEVAAVLSYVADVKGALYEAVRQATVAQLADLLDVLGIPGKPAVQIVALEKSGTHTPPLIRVSVNGQVCSYPDELLVRLYSYVCGLHLKTEMRIGKVLEWLQEPSAGSPEKESADPDDLVKFLSLACLEIIKLRPALLLGEAQAVAYCAALPQPVGNADLAPDMWPPDPKWLSPALATVLDLRISIADKQAVAERLCEGLSNNRSKDDIIEDLIASLRAETVEIQLPRKTLREITTTDTDNKHDQFKELREGLFYKWGLRYPEFRFVPIEELKPGNFAFKINHLSTLPRKALSPDQCLVNATVDELHALHVSSISIANPVGTGEFSLINVAAKADVEGVGLKTWDQMEHLVLCLGADLSANSSCFVHRKFVEEQFEKLIQAFPDLIKAVQSTASVEQITRVLRILLSDGSSILNLRQILEQVLDYDYIVADPFKFDFFDYRLPVLEQPEQTGLDNSANVALFVEKNVNRYIGYESARERNELSDFLIKPGPEEPVDPKVRSAKMQERFVQVMGRYTTEDIQAVVTLLFISNPRIWPKESETMAVKFLQKIGVDDFTDLGAIVAKISEYIEKNQRSTELLDDLTRSFRGEIVGKSDEIVNKILTKFVGS